MADSLPERNQNNNTKPTQLTVLPMVSINDVSEQEGDSATKNFLFKVTRSGSDSSLMEETTFEWAVTSIETDREDFGGSLPKGFGGFNPGQTETSIPVVVQGDTDFEPDETFRVTLSQLEDGQLVDGVGVGTILNDDPPET